jgi:HD-like signal output (HDOD) protein
MDDITRIRIDGPHAIELLADAQAVSAVIEVEEPDLRRVADVLQGRPLLAGHVLRMANSAGRGVTRPIVRVDHAVAMLGTSRLRAMAALIQSSAGQHTTRVSTPVEK